MSEKYIEKMLRRNVNIQMIAWYLLINTRIPNWEQAKKVAHEMRNEHDEKNDRTESEDE